MLAWFSDLNAARAAHHDRVLRRLVARRTRCAGLQLRHPVPAGAVEDHRWTGRRTGDCHAVDLGVRRLARRRGVRPVRPRSRAAGHHRLVRGVHLPVRLRTELRPTLHLPRPAGPGLRRRVGGRRRADGRGDPRQVSRPRRRHRADRLVDRLGRRGAALHHPDRHVARGAGLARAVLDWHPARRPGVLDPPLRRGTGAEPAPRGTHQHLAHLLRAEAAVSRDHLARRDDGDRRAGRQLRADDLAADLSEDGAAHLLGRHRQLSDGADPGRVFRLRLGRVSRRCDRSQGHVHDLGHRLGRC